MGEVTRYRGEPLSNGDELIDFKGERWTYRYTTRGVDDGKICVVPQRGGEVRMFFPSVFPGLTIEGA